MTTELAKQEVKPKIYSYNELRFATRDFHPENKLGEGGFGVVYKVHKKSGGFEGYRVRTYWINEWFVVFHMCRAFCLVA